MPEKAQNQTTQPSTDATPPPPNENQKKTLKIVLIVVGVLALLSIIGVALLGWFGWKIGERAIEEATGTEISRSSDGESLTIESQDGDQTFRQSAELPESFPDGVPIFDPSEVTFSQEINNPDGEAWNVFLSTAESSSDVKSFYQNELSSNGWSVLTTSDFGETSSITAENTSLNLRTTVNISREQGDDETTISLTATTINN
jgi:hypothetical protein